MRKTSIIATTICIVFLAACFGFCQAQPEQDLIKAVSAADARKAKELIPKVKNLNAVNETGSTALMFASGNGLTEVVKLLLDAGADPKVKNPRGHTALDFAVQQNYPDAAKLLLDKGADPNNKDADGQTALIAATITGHTLIIEQLLAKGADVKIARTDGLTPLIAAAGLGRADLVTLLLDKGAEVNARDKDKEASALQHAISNGDLETVELLVKKGADVNAKNKDGASAISITSDAIKTYNKMLEALKSAVGK